MNILSDFSRWLRRHTPASVIASLRWARKIFRRRNYYADKLFASQRGLTCSDLEAAFRQVGLNAGDVVLVHSAMSGLGLVQGGADTIIQALLEVITSSGTLAMPTFTVRDSMLACVQSSEPFHVHSTPSRTGKLTETFRRYPNTVRSVHPTHSVVALGPLAAWLTADHHLCTTPFGDGSPFVRLIEVYGRIMCIGVEISYITSYHAFEDLTPDFPEQVYLPETFSVPVVDAEGHRFTVETRAHDPQVSLRRIEKRPEVLSRVEEYLTHTDRLANVCLGKGRIYLVGAHELNEALGEMLRQGITIYAQK